MHLTGEYPDWWRGRRWDRPIRALAGSESSELTVKGVQRLLVGPPEDEAAWGTGFVPKRALADWSRRQGVANALANIVVKHRAGGNSTLGFASYDQGRTKWQADTLDLVWCDEEPPAPIYTEALTRTNATEGMVMVTFTPLLGMSDVVRRFLAPTQDDADGMADRAVTVMTIDDADHYTDEQKEKIKASYPPHEREARLRGVPSLGSGRVFPVAESEITCAPFEIPPHWPRIGGLDFGWDHPFAAVEIVWDRDADCIYVTKCVAIREATPIIHAAALKPWGDWLPWAWPHDGLQHDKGSGKTLADQYRAQGLGLLFEHATHPDGGYGLEAGISEMLQFMETGRFKVFSTLTEWLDEFRLYHRKDGLIVKERDDRISATRIAMMMRRMARTQEVRRPRGAYESDDTPRGSAWSG